MEKWRIPVKWHVTPEKRCRYGSPLHQQHFANGISISKCSLMSKPLCWNLLEVGNFLQLSIEVTETLASIDHIDIAMRGRFANAEDFFGPSAE